MRGSGVFSFSAREEGRFGGLAELWEIDNSGWLGLVCVEAGGEKLIVDRSRNLHLFALS